MIDRFRYCFRFSTVTSKCIQESNSQLTQLGCLKESKSDIQVKFNHADGTQITFGINQPLMIDGEIVQDEKNYPRYNNDFAFVPWGSKIFNISSIEGHYLYLDFDNLQQIAGP